jgi:hypothetical protein
MGVMIGLFAAGLWLILSAGGHAGDKPQVPKADLDRLIAEDAKTIQDVLAKEAPEKKLLRRVRTATILLLAYAHGSLGKDGSGPKEMVALRTTVLQLLKALDDNDLKAAAKLAADLPTPRGDGAAGAINMPKVAEFADVMNFFSSERIGGYAVENLLLDLADSKEPITPEEMKKLATFGYKMAMLSRLVDEYAGEKKEGGLVNPKNWLTHSAQFRKDATALAEATQTKNDGTVRAAVLRLNATCTKCHDIFKKQ